ncbi:MAG: NAD(P)-dependent oxidoreductase [Sandaracinaceae bacterium]
MRVLLADKLAPLVAARLQDLGAHVTSEPDLTDDALRARIAEIDPMVLVVRSTKVQKAHLEKGRALSLVIRAGAGVNTIDLEEANNRGIYVANCPGKNACAVAELTIGHLVNLDRRIADNVSELRAGRWNKKGFSTARGLNGRTLALIGFGQIGQEVARRARSLGMHVRAWSRSLDPDRARHALVEHAESPEKAVAGADAVSVHLALTHETRGRIGESVFDAIKPGAYFINTARAEVVDAAQLARAIEEKDLRVGLDVFADEPSGSTGEITDALAKHPNVYGTHHIGASTTEASEAVGEEVVAIVAAYQEGRPIPNCVNLAEKTEATHRLVVRHKDEVGVLASVLEVLRRAEINVQEMQNTLFGGGAAAVARIEIVGEPSAETLAEINQHPLVFDASTAAIGRR